MIRKPKAYIAGPMTGHSHFNFFTFDLVEARLRDKGYIPVSPAQIDRTMEGWGEFPPTTGLTLADRKNFIRRDLNAILELDPDHGDAIFLLPGWQNSKGAQAEYALAVFIGIEIYEILHTASLDVVRLEVGV